MSYKSFRKIGRHVLRMCLDQEELEVTAVNDINSDIDIVYTLNYDSILRSHQRCEVQHQWSIY